MNKISKLKKYWFNTSRGNRLIDVVIRCIKPIKPKTDQNFLIDVDVACKSDFSVQSEVLRNFSSSFVKKTIYDSFLCELQSFLKIHQNKVKFENTHKLSKIVIDCRSHTRIVQFPTVDVISH